MDSGYYAACAGMAAQSQALELVAHNLANVSTTGYRAQQATFRSLLTGYGSAGLNPLNTTINNFGVLGGSRLDLTAGSLTATGNPLDVAVSGKGFFALQSPAGGTLYSRDGSFHVTGSGQLMTSDGNAVLGLQGPITIPSGNLTISTDGTISVDGNLVDQLRLAEFAPGTSLVAVGNASYSAPAGTEQPAPESTLSQGMLEASNVSVTSGVVDLITVQRNTEMMARALTAFDSQLNQTAVQDLPKV